MTKNQSTQTQVNPMNDLIKLLEEKLESIKPLYDCRDRLRACVIVMESGSDALLRRREDGALDFFGHPGTAVTFALSGSQFEKAKATLDQIRKDNPASRFYLEKLSTAVVKSYADTEAMITRLRPLVAAQAQG